MAESKSITLTAETITDEQIRALRYEAVRHGDGDMSAICDLALDGEIDADDYTTLSREMDRSIRSMSREDACRVCAEATNDARAQEG